MVFRKAALAIRRRHDRDAQQLRKIYQLFRGRGSKHTLARENDRILCGEQGGNQLGNLTGIGLRHAAARLLIDIVGWIELFRQEIDGQFEKHGGRATIAETGDCRVHQLWQMLDTGNRLAPFRDVPKIAARLEIRRHRFRSPRIARRQEEDRRAVVEGLGDAAESALRARTVLYCDHGEFSPRRRASIALGNIDSHTRRPGYDRRNVEMG